MLTNYLKIAWRTLIKNKVTSFINIVGLALGMSIALLIGLWIYDEISFDRYFENHNRVARVMQNQTFNGQVETWGSQAMQMAPELRDKYADNFKYVIMSSQPGGHKLTFGNKNFTVNGNYIEPEVTEMLTLKMVKGSRSGLKDPYSILIAESVATVIFGNKDPIGKMIRMDDDVNVKISGVYKDLPDNTSFAGMTLIAPWKLLVTTAELEKRVGWGNSWFQCFVQIANHTDMESVSAKIKKAKMNAVIADKNVSEAARFKPEIFLFPMNKWHLYSDFKNGFSVGGKIQYVWLFGIVGVFVLLLACINFMNLSTAKSERRAKEVGIRKTIGSFRYQLVGQFFTESFVVVLFAFVLSLVLVQFALPSFNGIADKKINIPWSNSYFWLLSGVFIIVNGALAGSYPALFLSSFKPVRALKGTFQVGRYASVPRKVLVVIQFTVSIALIIGTIIIFRQIQYAKSRPIGYSQNGLIYSFIKTEEIRRHYGAFREELLATGAVVEVAASESPVTNPFTTNSGFEWEGKDPEMSEEFVTVGVTHEFGKTINWKIKKGRDFSKEFATDSSGFVINEAAVKYMGINDPVGKTIKWGNNGEWKIIGVIEDFISQSPYAPVKQMFFFLKSNRLSFINYNVVNLKINPNYSTAEALTTIEGVFKKYDPTNEFQITFADEEYAKKFINEKRIGKLASIFSSFAILISCLGLFGLASFVAEQRTKEIGIRKVLGASIANLWQMLSKDFIVLVALSSLIAIPISHQFMQHWLQNYEYRTKISWWIFLATVAGALVVTLLTVSFQAIKAAIANPLKSLRTE
jgi:putative ABC transport system permease protein